MQNYHAYPSIIERYSSVSTLQSVDIRLIGNVYEEILCLCGEGGGQYCFFFHRKKIVNSKHYVLKMRDISIPVLSFIFSSYA